MAAVCIFDGKERNHAKAREVSYFLFCHFNPGGEISKTFISIKARRRREVRELTVVRGSIEQNRFARLNQAKQTLQRFHKLSSMDKMKAAALLKADASFGDSDSTTLLQERLLVERTEDRTPVMPSPLTVDGDVSPVPLPAGAPFSLPVRCAVASLHAFFIYFNYS